MDFIRWTLGRGRQRRSHVEGGMSDSTVLQYPTMGGQRGTLNPQSEDKLTVFRHLVGILSAPSLAPNGEVNLSHNNLVANGRAAPNLGIYNRVVHRERQAKRGYKFAAVLINGCLGVQIVVAAALTAMGAAGSSSSGVTAFGAINTVIAGLLTYLKGSGLPMRLRYYENEWKKVREYIEQRERDFARPDCPLDVYEVVRVVEAMYEDVKADIQANTPDNFVSVGDLRNRQSATNPQIPSLRGLMDKGEKGKNGAASKIQEKLEELEAKYGHRVTDLLEGLARKEEERLKRMEEHVGRDVEGKVIEGRGMVEKELEIGKSRVLDSGKQLEEEVRLHTSEVVNAARDVQKEAESQVARAASAGWEAQNQVEANASRISNAARDVQREAESNGSRVVSAVGDVERGVERERANVAQLREDMEADLYAYGSRRNER